MSAALPRKIFPPLFNRYEGAAGPRLSRRQMPCGITGTAERVRTDLSATLFFSGADSYDGGELVIDDTYGPRAVKLPAGRMVLPSRNQSAQGESGHAAARVSSFFWMQSLVREDSQRPLLLDMDVAIQRLNQDAAWGIPPSMQLTGIYSQFAASMGGRLKQA